MRSQNPLQSRAVLTRRDTSTAPQVSTNARDMNALAAVSSRTYKKVATKGRSLVARQQSRMTGWAAAAAVASQQQSASQPQLAGAAPAAAAAFAGAPTPGPQGTSAGGAPTPLSMLGHPSALPDVNLLHGECGAVRCALCTGSCPELSPITHGNRLATAGAIMPRVGHLFGPLILSPLCSLSFLQPP